MPAPGAVGRLRVALLTPFIAPYRRPFVEDLAATPGWRLRVLVDAVSEFDRSWPPVRPAADVRRVRGLALRRRTTARGPLPYEERTTFYVPLGLWNQLRLFRPHVVVSSELGLRTAVAVAYGASHRIPLVARVYHSRVSAAVSGPRRVWRRLLLRRAACVVGMGRQAREALEAWGVPSGRILDALNAADAAQLGARLRTPEHAKRVEELRRTLGGGRRIALVAGRLVPLKGVAPLLAIWANLPSAVRDGWRLVFVGDGPLQSLVEKAEAGSVVYAGSAVDGEMADWYRAADLCVFASLGDVWGLVVNEALHCGTPVLCSVHAAACDDLIEPGVNGLTFDPADHAGAVAALTDALTRPDLGRLAAAGPASVERCSVDRLVETVRAAVERVVSRA